MNSEVQRTADGHYQLPLPFKNDMSLPNNRAMAIGLQQLCRRLKKDTTYKQHYTDIGRHSKWQKAAIQRHKNRRKVPGYPRERKYTSLKDSKPEEDAPTTTESSLLPDKTDESIPELFRSCMHSPNKVFMDMVNSTYTSDFWICFLVPVSSFSGQHLPGAGATIRESGALFYTDSRTVMGYIGNNDKQLQIFVANRVQQKIDVGMPRNWRYVQTGENPVLCFTQRFSHRSDR